MILIARFFDSALYFLPLLGCAGYITFATDGGLWGVGLLFAGAWPMAWARHYLRDRKFMPPKPHKPKQTVTRISRPRPVPVVAQARPPFTAPVMRYPDFVRPLPAALSQLILRGADEETGHQLPPEAQAANAAADEKKATK